MIKKSVIGAIRAYQCVSALFPFRLCRFYPTCSQYAIDAVARYGIFKGLAMACGRILRCSPLCDGGHDPVR